MKRICPPHLKLLKARYQVYNSSFPLSNIFSPQIQSNAAYNGGGAYINAYSPAISSSTISSNNALCGNGGGIMAYAYSLSLSSSTVDSNIVTECEGDISTSTGHGGGLYLSYSTPPLPIFTSSTISNNGADNMGGGVCLVDASPIFQQMVVTGNKAGMMGGGVCVLIQSEIMAFVKFDNTQLLRNTASRNGGGVSFFLLYFYLRFDVYEGCYFAIYSISLYQCYD